MSGIPPMIEIPEEMVQAAMMGNVSWVCAHCNKFWWGVQSFLDKCKAAVQNVPCGGPVARMAFPQYEGPLTVESLANHCFVCGAEADAVIEVPPDEKKKTPGGMIGACKTHIELVKTFSKEGEPPPTVTEKTLEVRG